MEPSSPQPDSRTARPLRYLRIAFSITCGIACVLLLVLWVRSYSRCDSIWFRLLGSPKIGMVSVYGCLAFGYEQHGSKPAASIEIDSVSLQADSWLARKLESEVRASLFKVTTIPGGRRLDVPSYSAVLLVLMTTTIAAKPWITWRFSLRTLLIAMTLVAVGLGVVAMMMRRS